MSWKVESDCGSDRSTPRKKILYYSEGWGRGGIEAFIVNCIRALDNGEYEFGIFSTHDWDQGYDAELFAHGVIRSVVFKGNRPNLLIRLLFSMHEWAKLLTTTNYDIVHINTMNGLGFLYAYIAYKKGVKCRVVHSHNSKYGTGLKVIKEMAHRFGRRAFGRYATDRIACSNEAGKYLFGSQPFAIIKNAVDTKRFRFSEDSRSKLRKKFGISDSALVLGFIGRLTKVKNPEYVLSVFTEVLKDRSNAALVMVGSGPLDSEIETSIDGLLIRDKVIKMATSDEIPDLMSIMDVLCVPSTFEGLPMICVEAQANGLELIMSEFITKEVSVTNKAHFLSIGNAPSVWSDAIISLPIDCKRRIKYADIVENAGYGIGTLHEELRLLYR